MSCLPLGLNQIEIQRGLTTSSTAIFVPVSYTHLDVYKRQGIEPVKVPVLSFSGKVEQALFFISKLRKK